MSSSICNICKENPWKYKCPQCGRRTCSLECSKQHKLLFDCQGKIQVTAFVDRKTLTSTPHALNRDYAFLQKINRRLELTGQDDESHMVTRLSSGKRKRYSQSKIVKNGVNISCLPPGMQRAKRNKSGWNPKRKKFIWTIEYRDFTRPDRPLTTKDVTDDTVIKSALDLPSESKAKVWLHYKSQGSTNYVLEVDHEKELSSQLLGKTVVEYPTFIITESGGLPTGYEEFKEETSDSSSSSEEDTSDSDDSDSEGPEELSTKQGGHLETNEDSGPADLSVTLKPRKTLEFEQNEVPEKLTVKQYNSHYSPSEKRLEIPEDLPTTRPETSAETWQEDMEIISKKKREAEEL